MDNNKIKRPCEALLKDGPCGIAGYIVLKIDGLPPDGSMSVCAGHHAIFEIGGPLEYRDEVAGIMTVQKMTGC